MWCFVAQAADDYYYAGLAIAVSLVHEGPAPRFMAKHLFDALVGEPDKVKIPLDELPECPMKEDLTLVRLPLSLGRVT